MNLNHFFDVAQISAIHPDPAVAWLMALGFLGLVILRRTRSH